jgi:hypothetical protein
VLGGLAISTLFTLILVPVVFTLTLDFQKWLRGRPGSELSGLPKPVAIPTVLPEIEVAR